MPVRLITNQRHCTSTSDQTVCQCVFSAIPGCFQYPTVGVDGNIVSHRQSGGAREVCRTRIISSPHGAHPSEQHTGLPANRGGSRGRVSVSAPGRHAQPTTTQIILPAWVKPHTAHEMLARSADFRSSGGCRRQVGMRGHPLYG